MTEAEYWSLQHEISKLLKSKTLEIKKKENEVCGIHPTESIYLEGVKDGIIAVKAMLSEKYREES